ncbi:MAG: hypothetical protein RR212_14495 [Bacteroidales bacterium]
MTTFLRIPDKIQQLSEGEIQRHYIRPFLPAFFLVLGMFLVWFGGREAFVKEGESYLMTIIGLVIVVISIIILLSKRYYFIIKSTLTPIKPIRININPQYQQEVVDLIAKDRINDILHLKSKNRSPLCLEIWYSRKHNKVYSQLLYFYDAGMRPISLVHVTNEIDLNRSLLI